MDIGTIGALAPKKARWLVNQLIEMDSVTYIAGSSHLHRTVFIADLMFSACYGLKFHNRGINPSAVTSDIYYYGNLENISRILWAWNIDRHNADSASPVLGIPSGLTMEEFYEIMKTLPPKKPKIIFIDANLAFAFPPEPSRLNSIIKDWRREFGGTWIVGFDGSYGVEGKQLCYSADAFIELKNDPKEQFIEVVLVRQRLNDHPVKFALAKHCYENVLVFKDSNALDPAVEIIYSKSKTEKIRIIDALAALNQSEAWPTLSSYSRMLGVTGTTAKAIQRRLEHSEYIDSQLGEFTEKGKSALRDAGLLAFGA